MQGLDDVFRSSGMDIGGLASRFGLSPEQATAALGTLVPALAGGMQKRADQGGLDAVTAAGDAAGEPDVGTGNEVLGHIFGSKDVSRQVADHAAGQAGVSSTVVKAMLPIVAAMLAKHLAGTAGGTTPAGAGGGLGGMIGSILGGDRAGGLGGLGAMLGGRNPLDAILEGGRR